jgi:carbohydrate diacid regulator
MLIGTEEFERIAWTIATHISGILGANAWVVDKAGNLLASKEYSPERNRRNGNGRNGNGRSVQSGDGDEGESYFLRVPIGLGSREAELVISAPTNGETMSPRVARTLADLIANQMLATAQLSLQGELRHKFIHDLLRGMETNEAQIIREGQILGMDFHRQRAVLLIEASDYILASASKTIREPRESLIAKRTQDVMNTVVRFFRLPNDAICAYLGEGEVAVLKASSTQDLKEWAVGDAEEPLNPSWSNLAALKKAGAALLTRINEETNACISIGIGRYHPGILGLARSYQDARAALTIGRRLHGDTRIYCLDELGIAAFIGLADENIKLDLARHLLSPLDHEPELLDTLQVFFDENCHPSVTANRLCIHRNTLSYRLDKIAVLSGLDPRCFNEAVQIRLALMLRAMWNQVT